MLIAAVVALYATAGVNGAIAGVAVALGYAGGVERAGRAVREPSEVTALLLVAALAGGVVLASDVFESGAAVDRLLFGTLLGLETADLALSAVTVALAVVASLALPSARHRREQALALGIDDLPPEPIELHVPDLHLPGHHGHHGESGRPQG